MCVRVLIYVPVCLHGSVCMLPDAGLSVVVFACLCGSVCLPFDAPVVVFALLCVFVCLPYDVSVASYVCLSSLSALALHH